MNQLELFNLLHLHRKQAGILKLCALSPMILCVSSTLRSYFKAKGDLSDFTQFGALSLSFSFWKYQIIMYFGTKALLLLFSSCNMVLQLLSSINKHHPESYCIIKPLSLKEHSAQKVNDSQSTHFYMDGKTGSAPHCILMRKPVSCCKTKWQKYSKINVLFF